MVFALCGCQCAEKNKETADSALSELKIGDSQIRPFFTKIYGQPMRQKIWQMMDFNGHRCIGKAILALFEQAYQLADQKMYKDKVASKANRT